MLFPTQAIKLLFLYDQSSLGKNAIEFLHKEVDKKPLNQTIQNLFSGSNDCEEKHVLQSPLPY